jgi:AraC-like DNA-binding protein
MILSFGDRIRARGQDRVSFAAGIGEKPDVTEQGQEAGQLTDRLHETSSWAARFDLLDAYLEARLGGAPQPSSRIAHVFNRLVRSRGRLRVDALASEVGWSRRTLSGRFHDEVGLPPKRFARLLRFQSAVGLLGKGSHLSLATVAHAAGYADQAHFNHEFLALAGCTPRQFIAALPLEGAGLQA